MGGIPSQENGVSHSLSRWQVAAGGRGRGLKPFSTDEAVADARKTADEVRALAAEARGLVKDVRESNGAFMKFVKDDELHKDAKALLAKADRAIGTLEGE